MAFESANVWVVTASGMCYCSNILTVATLGLCLLTVAGTTVWRLRVANVWVVTASAMCYSIKNLTVATLGLCLLTQFLAQKCGVSEWPMFGWLLRAE